MNSSIPRLGVNIDHVATLRQARGTPYPNLMEAALAVKKGGADQITVHLREDRRHIQPEDVKTLVESKLLPINLEMAATKDMLKFANKVKPFYVCLVPEKRQELTTEGGLDLSKNLKRIDQVIQGLKRSNIKVSLFIEPSVRGVKLAWGLGVDAVEFHTGKYALLTQRPKTSPELKVKIKNQMERIEKAAEAALKLQVSVHAGHGLDYLNTRPLLLKMESVESVKKFGKPLILEYNIGHSIVSRAMLVGMETAVREMRSLIVSP